MRTARLPQRVLMLVVDPAREGDRLDHLLRETQAGGVNAVQLRTRSLDAGEFLRLARRVRGLCNRSLLFINDRVDVALMCGADGVQLGQHSLPPSAVRALAPASFLVGVSVHSVAEARQAEQDGADLLVAGTIFPSPTHPGQAPQGLELLTAVRERVTLPVVAIGGITAETASECWRAGCRGVAAITALTGAADPRAAAAQLWETGLVP